jgi:7-cyano-7-deazaguanine synthase
MKTIVILSGGLDSTTLLFHLKDEGHVLHALTFDYGQRHRKEIEAAKIICELTDTPQEIVDVSALGPFFGSNALTNQSIVLPSGEYSQETIDTTKVPNRNMIMLSIAISRAISLAFDAVAFGAHSGFNEIMYPDCSPAFVNAMQKAANACDQLSVEVLAPFVLWTKTDVLKRGAELCVPFENTWSCYEGSSVPCGKCGTCWDREAAFSQCALVDPLSSTSK